VKRTGQVGWILTAIICLMSGCQSFNEENTVYSKYYKTTLAQSTSADVLGHIYDPLDEYLSQSESVVAAWNQIDKGQSHWFNMVAFDEDTLRAIRKYGFSCIEQRLGPNAPPRPKMRLDAELIIDPEVLEAVYPTQNAKYIAVLQNVRKHFQEDALQLTTDSQILHSSTMMVNQALNGILVKLQETPALASHLPWLEGVEFDHPTIGQSRIRMLILGDIVKIKIKASKAWFKDTPFEKQPDVIYM
jgi:hypothetical protein